MNPSRLCLSVQLGVQCPTHWRETWRQAGDTPLSEGVTLSATLLAAAAAGAPRREHAEPVRAKQTSWSTFQLIARVNLVRCWDIVKIPLSFEIH